MSFARHTFKTGVHTHRPEGMPPGPYWHTGFTCNPNDESLSDEFACVTCYLPRFQEVRDWWPDAHDIETTICEEIQFSERFPRPAWWQPELWSVK